MKSKKTSDSNNNSNSKKTVNTSSKKTIDNNSTQPDIQLSPSVKDHQIDDNEYFKKLIIQKINCKTLSISNKKVPKNSSVPIKGNETELVKKPLNNARDEKFSNIMYKLHCNSNNLNNLCIIPNNFNNELLKLETDDDLSEINLLNYDTKALQTPKELLEENLKKHEEQDLKTPEIYQKAKLKKRNSMVESTSNKKCKDHVETLNLSNIDIKNNSASLNNSTTSIKTKFSKPLQKNNNRTNYNQDYLSAENKKKNNVNDNSFLQTNDINKEFLDLIPFFENMIGNNFHSFNEKGLLDCLDSQDKNMLIKGLIYCVLELNKKVKSVPILEGKLSSENNRNLKTEKISNLKEKLNTKNSSRNEIVKSNLTISYDDNNNLNSKSFGKILPNLSKKGDNKTNSKSKHVNTKF